MSYQGYPGYPGYTGQQQPQQGGYNYSGYGAGQYAGYGAGQAAAGQQQYPGYPSQGQSAYNVNQYPQYGGGYQHPYSTGHQAYPGQQPGYGQAAANPYQQQSGAVPGFTTPAAPSQYGPSAHYGYAQNAMANSGLQNAQWRMWQRMGLVNNDKDLDDEMEAKARRKRRNITDSDDEDSEFEEMKRKMEERAKQAEEEVARMRKRLEEDDGLKNELRAAFIKELIRRQECNGTFEETNGTVMPFTKYDEEDPVCQWFQKEKGQDINGEDWDGMYDAEYLRKAVRGFGTDEAAIIAVVSTRCNAQRNRIMKEYKTAYGRDLCKDLRGDLSGNFEEVVLALFETPARYDAWSLKKAIYGLGTNERTLIEVLMTRTNAQLNEMVQEYDQITYAKQKHPEASLERDIEGDCSGHFKRLLISAAQGNRRLIDLEKLTDAVEETQHDGKWTGMFHVNYEKLCNRNKCHRMAQELLAAGEEKWGTDEETFNRIFATQDFYSLRMVWDEYVKVSQRDILNSLDRETSGDYRKGLLAIAQSVKCRPMFFAERLYKSMKGAGTDDSTLIRIIVSRSEIDMVQIKQCFLDKYGKTLWRYVKKDVSGDYRKLMLALVGEN